MTIINTIPDKIPQRLIKEMRQEKYDTLILFILAVYGPHELSELVNDASKSIENRLDKDLFDKWADELKQQGFIEEYMRNSKKFYKITIKGEDEFMNRLENVKYLARMVHRLMNAFDNILGGSFEKDEIKVKSDSDNILSYKCYVFGLLSIQWRLNDIFNAGDTAKFLKPEDYMSVGNIFEDHAKNQPDRLALLYEDRRYTYKEINDWMNRYANYFLSLGIKKGDVINVFLENRPELYIMIGAMTKIGTIASLINTRQRSKTLIHSLSLLDARAHVIGEELFPAYKDVMPDLELTKDIKLYFLRDKGNMDIPEGFKDFEEEVKDQSKSVPLVINDIKGKDIYAYIFTSGTTGLPKAAPMRHVHMISSTNGWGKMALNMQPEDIVYITLPLFHSNAVHIGVGSALAGGSAIALARKFSVRNFWNDVRKFKATCFNYIGELCRYLLNQPPNPEDQNHNVYKIMGNGLRPEIWKDFKERFGIRGIYEHYGQTELRGMFCNYFNIDCTIGVSFDPYALVKYDIDADEPIKDENGFLQNVEPGEAGLLLLRINDPTTFAGYTSKEATEKKIIRNPFGNGELWYNSGDMIRNIGYYHAQFVDRLGDTFRWKGENVSTSEVEDVFSSFEQIDHSSVYGVEIPGTNGRAGMASIITNIEVENFNFDGLFKSLKENLPPYAIPKFLRFLTDLSTTSTFKIKKSDMKREGFDINQTKDMIYVYLPGSSGYTHMTEEIYNNINNGKYRF